MTMPCSSATSIAVRSGVEDLLDWQFEIPRQRKRERQRRRVALGLDGVDGLPGNAHRPGKIALRELSGGSELANPVFHYGCKVSLSPARCQVGFTGIKRGRP